MEAREESPRRTPPPLGRVARGLTAAIALTLLVVSTVAGTSARPFVGEWLTVDGPPPAELPPGCEAYFPTSQSGIATHLGKFTGTGSTCGWNIRVVGIAPLPVAGDPPYLVVDFTVAQTWTAANGDELDISGDNAQFVQSLVNGASAADGTLHVLGGTGRFEGASGEATVAATDDLVTFSGWIAYGQH